MNKFILTIGFLLIASSTWAQELKESDLDKLLFLPGKVETYYSEGVEIKAKYLQELVTDAVLFYQNKLKDTFDIKLLVLNKNDWKFFVGGSYILPDFATDPDRIEMGINEIYKIKLPENKSLYGKNEIFFWNFIAVHELGHYILHHYSDRGLFGFGEFFADYIQIGFLIEKIPEWQFPSTVSSQLFRYLPLKYKSMEDFLRNYNRIDPLNYSLYEGKFYELAYNIFEDKGWDFLYEFLDKRNIRDSTINKKLLFERSLSYLNEMEPEFFNEWLQGMRKTYHSCLVFCILILIIGAVRLLDNSFSIFIGHGLKTKKRYRIFGVSIFSVISVLKGFENQKIRRKLKLILGLRPIMYICILLLVLLLIIHH